ncbi:hypothetical protein L1987_83613 [Smallanthus sonchifolius]|uniref:Uncharacterized protein n=1 Tax=Smallanthus sonchifolius TaxID=185202 RepID=A0ACB8YDB6_9ASTR|nr:hypothetical protein L1987_83613 [Smallanthus sonchifolius]
MSPVITCAAALNPTINVFGVETLIDRITYALNLDSEDIHFAQGTKTYFNKCLQDLFDVYLHKYGTTPTPHDTMGTSSSGSSRDVNLNLYKEMLNEFSKRARGTTPSSELGRYIGTKFLAFMPPTIFEEFDILAWWKKNGASFPILSAMARDVLTVQASTVTSESAFSFSGMVLSIRRTRLTPLAMEMCICLKDHLDAMDMIQDQTSLEDEIQAEEIIHNNDVDLGISEPVTDEELAEDARLRSSSSEDNAQD